MDPIKNLIIRIFREKVQGKKPDVRGINSLHDGAKGHWLERQFGIVANGNNAPDIYGYELKSDTANKTTFGDWSANEYIYNKYEYSNIFSGHTAIEKRDKFLEIFGHADNKKHPGRFSWSGKPCPKLRKYSDFGQTYKFENNDDIVIIYNFEYDLREYKSDIVPVELQREDLELAKWYGYPKHNMKGKSLSQRVNDKFGVNGWFTCKTDNMGFYDRICFGEPMTYGNWLRLVKEGKVYLDSGMHQGNPRPYSEWRADNKLWDSLIVEEYS